MARQDYTFDKRIDKYIRRETHERVDYDLYTTRQWVILIAFF